MENIFDVRRGDVQFSTSDVGWIVGHSYIVYGPLVAGISSVFFEGKPHIPNAGIIWQKCEQYKVSSLFMAPTGVRMLKKEDYQGLWPKRFDLSRLKGFGMAGERCDPESVKWLSTSLPQTVINDTWWQTETGWPITGNILN
jgi:propionyl-CoA synthetase